jgi:cytidylate kinase
MSKSAPSTCQPGWPQAPAGAGGLVIAVDGPAGSGKSSAARGAALALGLRYLDTGAMYRALTWWLLAEGVDTADRAAVLRDFSRAVIEIGTDPAAPAISVAGQDVAGPIRTRQVSNAVSAVASLPPVREFLIRAQRAIIAEAAAGPGIVAEAPVKVFLTASETIRAQRRAADLAADPSATADLTRLEQARRDRRDAPQMARAGDAVEIDTTALTLEQVIAEIVGLARSRRPVQHG